MFSKLFQRVSQAPTNPQTTPAARAFDVADLYRGPGPVPELLRPLTRDGLVRLCFRPTQITSHTPLA